MLPNEFTYIGYTYDDEVIKIEKTSSVQLVTASVEGKGHNKSVTQLDGVMESRRNVALQTKGAGEERRRRRRTTAAESKQKLQCQWLEVVEPVLSITL